MEAFPTFRTWWAACPSWTSQTGMSGINLEAIIYSSKKSANVPMVIGISIDGLYRRQVKGIRVMVSEIGMMTKRSIHMPATITIPTISISQGVRRHFLFHRIAHGITTLQINMVTHTQANGPCSWKSSNSFSNLSPPYQGTM